MGLTITHFIIMTLCSIEDIRSQRISMSLLGIGIPIGIMFQVYYHKLSIWSLLAGVGIGLLIMLISFITGEKIGMGDGAVLAVTGLLLGGKRTFTLFVIASGLSGMTALFIFLKRKNGKQEIPFIPFLFLASLMVLYFDSFSG